MGDVHPYEADRRAEEHYRRIVALAQVVDPRPGGRPDGGTVRAWRLAVGQRLVTAGLHLCLPPSRRLAARRQAQALLAGDEMALDRPLPRTC